MQPDLPLVRNIGEDIDLAGMDVAQINRQLGLKPRFNHEENYEKRFCVPSFAAFPVGQSACLHHRII
jgi:hypothetical protein